LRLQRRSKLSDWAIVAIVAIEAAHSQSMQAAMARTLIASRLLAFAKGKCNALGFLSQLQWMGDPSQYNPGSPADAKSNC
jgi:hypothetical protein